jgi:hypothetical protein
MILKNALPINQLPIERRKFFILLRLENYTFAFMKFDEDCKDG